MGFVIHWHESAMELHVFPIAIPPPTSLSTQFLWVFPVHQARALVSCIPPGPVTCFTIDKIHAVLSKHPTLASQSFSFLFHLAWCPQDPSMLLQMERFHSYFWLSNILLCVCVHTSPVYPFICWWTLNLLTYLGYYKCYSEHGGGADIFRISGGFLCFLV